VEAFLVSTGVVALAEIGDKTQLLSMIMAARFKKPLPIIVGILVATILNHALASFAGTLVGSFLEGPWFRWILGGSFLAVAVWALFPDKIDEEAAEPTGAYGAFAATTVAFFIAEIGDKTQIATVALAAKYQIVAAVTAGTTLGMMLANVPAVIIGNALASRLPLKPIRFAAAALFAALGIAALLGVQI
jgi:putative Ca2+/H+ antiporter (TMEM165/GDT1 family)